MGKFTISLKTALTSIIVVVISFLVINILFFAYQGNKYTTFKITEKLMYQIFSTTAQKLNFYFESSHQGLLDLKFTLENKKYDLEKNPQEFLVYLKKTVLVNSIITGAYLGDEKGSFYMAKRMADGSISYRVIRRTKKAVVVKWTHKNPIYEKDFPSGSFSFEEGYDPRKRPWYIKAQKGKKAIWTDPYIFASDRLLGISVASPINKGNIRGVFALDFGLAEINDFLKDLPISKISSLFLFDKSDRIMAYSSQQKSLDLFYKEVVQEGGKKSVTLLEIPDINDPLLSSLYSDYKKNTNDLHSNTNDLHSNSLYDNQFFITVLDTYLGFFINQEELLTDNQIFFEGTALNANGKENQVFYSTYKHQGETYLFMLKNFTISDSFNSKLGIIIPQSVVVSYFYYTYQIILFSTVVALIISLTIITLIMNKSISKPIVTLSNRIVDMVDKFKLDAFNDRGTKLKEIQHMSTSIESVRRALISFKKYLPKEVVSNLIKSGKEARIGGEKKEITIFFSDIKDFTKISEENPSDILFEKLKEYFNIVDNNITKHDGILDKYIGDAVMAMWGIPVNIPNHAASACLAALEIKKELEKLNKRLVDEEFPKFVTRIGIHTGTVLVGNIGSENRLNYTCIGDNVNLASRLEGLNKFYKTQILVSNITLQHAKDFVEFRMIDRVIIKGKTQKILIHEVIAKKGELQESEQEFLNLYKKGIQFYFEEYWEDAIIAFEKALKIKSDDFITQIYLKKSKIYADKKAKEANRDDMTLDIKEDK